MIDYMLAIACASAATLIPAYYLLIAVSEYNKGKERIRKMEARHKAERKEFAEWKESVNAILNKDQ